MGDVRTVLGISFLMTILVALSIAACGDSTPAAVDAAPAPQAKASEVPLIPPLPGTDGVAPTGTPPPTPDPGAAPATPTPGTPPGTPPGAPPAAADAGPATPDGEVGRDQGRLGREMLEARVKELTNGDRDRDRVARKLGERQLTREVVPGQLDEVEGVPTTQGGQLLSGSRVDWTSRDGLDEAPGVLLREVP